ncbi:MAG TPA: GntR family transcriptional regulator [Candidimonas sp.]|nr:GntR family transcriptional regulator [Candidimonas sp.]
MPLPTRPANRPVARIARYLDVANSLIKEIADGRHVVGSLLPTEHDLAEQYGVSRHTVRASLKILQDKGYISRKKSVGSKVENANPEAAYTQSFGSIDDLVHVAATEVRSLQDKTRVTIDRPTARRLEAPIGSDWILFTGTRHDVRKRGTPISWVSIYINPAFEKITAHIQESPHILVSSLIEQECGQSIAEVRQIISGTLIDPKLAQALNTQANSAGLRVVRHYKDQHGKILEITETIYPAERVSVSLQLRRGKSST